jgi:hypothetical protein
MPAPKVNYEKMVHEFDNRIATINRQITYEADERDACQQLVQDHIRNIRDLYETRDGWVEWRHVIRAAQEDEDLLNRILTETINRDFWRED